MLLFTKFLVMENIIIKYSAGMLYIDVSQLMLHIIIITLLSSWIILQLSILILMQNILSISNIDIRVYIQQKVPRSMEASESFFFVVLF